MYMGVMFALTTLLVIAFIASIFGGLAYTPLSIVSGAALFIVTCLIANYVLGYVFKVKAQYQSAIISGLILGFLFTPPSEVRDYLIISLIAVIAMASKYLLAWRGRHIFNPAAVAAVIIACTGITAASWWVATPILLVPVVLFGTFTLYRTHRLAMGYLYIFVAVVISLLVTAVQGSISLETTWMVIASYPILFLAFFMLTEPLTQAPRNWQRNSIAVAIAALASSQLFVGTVLITPEIALIIGNVIAFLFGQQGATKLRFVDKHKYGNGQVEYRFVPLRPLRFKAGQYIELSLPHKHADMRGMRRIFSIASGEDVEVIQIVTRHSTPSSSFKAALDTLKQDDIVPATGVYGDFVLPKDKTDKLAFLAGGIGITPFLSHLANLTATRDIVLLYFIRNEADIVRKDELRKAEAQGVKVVFIQDQTIAEALKQHVNDGADRVFYVSGAPGFVDTAKLALKNRSKKVVTDYFSGY
jgi:ferredoxin-NADP reductase